MRSKLYFYSFLSLCLKFYERLIDYLANVSYYVIKVANKYEIITKTLKFVNIS